MKKSFKHHVYIEQLKPIVENGCLYFPLKVENSFVEEDGLVAGLPVDSGAYAFVTYEKAVGVLAEDTLALYYENPNSQELKENIHQLSKVFGWQA